MALAHLRNGHPYAQLAAGFGVGTTTAYRYIAEAVEVLAALAPTWAGAVRTASLKAFVLLDGTLLLIDRTAADRPFYSGKHKKLGMNVQVRNACKDLRHAGLVESVGKTSRMGAGGRPVSLQLWNLTTAGLAAASELGRPVKEMGGTAREAAKAGAAHALAVTNTIDAIRQSPPLPTKPVARRTSTPGIPAQARELPSRPAGLGHLRGWETEVALPVVGTFTAPGRGSLRADAVLTAPEDGLPVLFVEVDNHTEPAAGVAAKIDRYRTFFQRTVKDHRGQDVELWPTVWEDSGRGGYPPLALVFTKDGGTEAWLNRMKKIADLSRDAWQGPVGAPGTPVGHPR